MLYTVYLMVIMTAFTALPYSMLIYASKIKYLATMSYMAFFLVLVLVLILVGSFKLQNFHLHTSFIVAYLS